MPWLLLDVAWLVVFAAIGRQSHGEGDTIAGVAAVAWPFLAGYAVGAIALRLPRTPRSLVRVVPVWAITLAVAMALRTVEKGRAPELDFVIVAAAFTLLGMAGWRVVALLVCRRRAAARAATGA